MLRLSGPSANQWKLIKPDQYAAIFICQFITVALLQRINESLILNEPNGGAEAIINLKTAPELSKRQES